MGIPGIKISFMTTTEEERLELIGTECLYAVGPKLVTIQTSLL